MAIARHKILAILVRSSSTEIILLVVLLVQPTGSAPRALPPARAPTPRGGPVDQIGQPKKKHLKIQD